MARTMLSSAAVLSKRKPPSKKGAKMVSGREKTVNKALPKSLRGGKRKTKSR
jgi:hypothetical protein